MSIDQDNAKSEKKRAVVKAALIGFAVGVAFMLTAKFVNFAMMA